MPLAIKSIILGLIQGLTEFLPISSTGHMIIADEFLDLPAGFREMFLVVVQLGSILSVLVYFRKKLFPASAVQSKEGFKAFFMFWLKIAIGVVPAVIIGGLAGSAIKEHLYSTTTVAIALLIGGIVILAMEMQKRQAKFSTIDTLPYLQAFLIGVFQCLAMIPGTSRSAATIIGALIIGTSRELAVEYSFYLAIPTMFAASAYSLLKEGTAMTAEQWCATGAGFVTAFISALAVIALFMSYIRKKDFKVFGWYRIALAVVIILFFALTGK